MCVTRVYSCWILSHATHVWTFQCFFKVILFWWSEVTTLCCKLNLLFVADKCLHPRNILVGIIWSFSAITDPLRERRKCTPLNSKGDIMLVGKDIFLLTYFLVILFVSPPCFISLKGPAYMRGEHALHNNYS